MVLEIVSVSIMLGLDLESLTSGLVGRIIDAPWSRSSQNWLSSLSGNLGRKTRIGLGALLVGKNKVGSTDTRAF